MFTLFQDIRYALRQLRNAPVFTITAVLTLALGIGANTAVFTMVQQVLLNALPVGNPGGLYRVGDKYNCCVEGDLQKDWTMFSYPLYEYLRGPRSAAEIAHQEDLLPADRALPFGAVEATIAARLYRVVPRARQREFDIAIAAIAIAHDVRLWTANTEDFRDIPGLQLYEAPA